MSSLNDYVEVQTPKLHQYFKQVTATASQCSTNLVIGNIFLSIFVTLSRL